MKRRAILAIAIAILLIGIIPASTGAAGSQTWYFTSANYSGIPAAEGTYHILDKIMNTTPPVGLGNLTLIGEVSNTEFAAWWYADEPAQVGPEARAGRVHRMQHG